MRFLSRLPLDDDITHRILTHLDNFSSLHSTISTCKSVHAVYESHPRSIRRAITRNIVGPAFNVALSLAQMQTRSSSSRDTAKEERLLENSRVVKELEDIFSHR